MNDKINELKNRLKLLKPDDYVSKNYDSLVNIDQIEQIIRQIEGENLKKLLKQCRPGTKEWKKFQDFCFSLVQLTLEKNEFCECKTRSELVAKYVPQGIKGLRKDIIIPLIPKQFNTKDDVKNIWDEFRNEPWNCSYLVFDAKNYKNGITHTQIYQMFHYLNKRNGKIGIIFTRQHSIDKSGKAALIRIRDDNYMVFVLNDKDIEKWIDTYIEQGNIRVFFRDLKTQFDHSSIV